ncbi:unnamed protein product [Lepeophtheirus salmonis]|uniref:(salmon louse) hypothetical protein n=1 Tax=Lepeophtheirus salmonis TaxID=72036 RepID=A0A7R8H7S7_LEPSM|nr:unnamed protein product [Lepeophtheirus salmonis]CAF2926316.1 unnamed protein product [Lepeophtheirus salmonis]
MRICNEISLLLLSALIPLALPEQFNQYPQGYYPFEESPAKVPPKVRKPPYLQTQVPCPGQGRGSSSKEQTLDNLCGDLNKGYLPINPIRQSVQGDSYPFDLIKTKTLEFFSKTLPILKADDTLPKVAKFSDSPNSYSSNGLNIHSVGQNKINFYHHRTKRSLETDEPPVLKELHHAHLKSEEETKNERNSCNC